MDLDGEKMDPYLLVVYKSRDSELQIFGECSHSEQFGRRRC